MSIFTDSDKKLLESMGISTETTFADKELVERIAKRDPY
jgi:hypothetical protein